MLEPTDTRLWGDGRATRRARSFRKLAWDCSLRGTSLYHPAIILIPSREQSQASFLKLRARRVARPSPFGLCQASSQYRYPPKS